MTTMRKTLLQIIQDILSDTDGEPINTISGSLEGEQAATIIEHTFYDMIANRVIPEHQELIELTAASDSDYPTHFRYPDNVKDICRVWYDKTKALVGTGEYAEVKWIDPIDFLSRIDNFSGTYQTVNDKNAGTKLRIQTDKFPEYYTSFDDEWIVMDSINSSYDDTLQASKVRAFGVKYPIFDRFDDNHYPDLDDHLFPYLVSESRARFMDWYKGGVTQKAEQAARRNKTHAQNDKYRTERSNKRNDYGRHS